MELRLEPEDQQEGGRRTIARLVEQLMLTDVENAALRRTVKEQASIIERLQEEGDPEEDDEDMTPLSAVADTHSDV